jgi:hypothetical protein
MRTRQVKDSELRKEWKWIDEALIPPELLADMPQPECKALTLLVDAMINSTVCDVGPGRGQITAKVDDDIYITLDVEQTVRNRISKQDPKTVARLRDWETYPHTAMEIWVFKLIHNRDYGRFPDGFKFPACVHGPKASIPALDDCASFVYWAEAGFPNPPSTILDAVLHARDPAAWQKAVDMRVRNHREARRLERMRQELLHAERLERQRKEKEAEAERHRVMSLGWRGLIGEHQEVGFPITGDDMLDGRRSDISHMLRESLLDPEARARARAKSRAARESHENLQQRRFYRNVIASREDTIEQGGEDVDE